eukprot:m51a1_g342 putative FAM49 family protein (313) ;mRNA; f:528309-529897
MGQIFGKKSEPPAFIDLENAQPTPEEMEVFSQLREIMQPTAALLQKLTSYTGHDEYIRNAITKPSPETESAAWQVIVPAVDQLLEFYEFSLQLEQRIPSLLGALCNGDVARQNLLAHTALAKQLCEIFNFVLLFDDAKMVNPGIQNDFSYYRRALNRMKMEKKAAEVRVRDDLANRMSLFFAYPTPMMKLLADTTIKFLSTAATSSVTQDKVASLLANLANICREMMTGRRFDNPDTSMLCLRAMTGSIILYDHVAETGAFCKKSPIRIRECITELRGYTNTPTTVLINALRFTTVHLNDVDTPASVKQLLV